MDQTEPSSPGSFQELDKPEGSWEIEAELLKQSVEKIPKHLRPNTLRIEPGLFEELAAEQDLELERVSWLKHPAYRVLEGVPGKTFLHELGFCFSQSLSSMLPVLLLDPKPCSLLLDCCAAPGAKTTLAGELMQNSGGILALERNEIRMTSLVANLKRMGIINCCAWHADAIQVKPSRVFDYLLVDPPCTSLGTASGYRTFNKANMRKLAKKQRMILENAWKFLKPGGEMVYSTCTITEQENEENIRWLIEEKGAVEQRIDLDSVPGAVRGAEGLGILLLPWKFPSEGFYIAKLSKQGDRA